MTCSGTELYIKNFNNLFGNGTLIKKSFEDLACYIFIYLPITLIVILISKSLIRIIIYSTKWGKLFLYNLVNIMILIKYIILGVNASL